MKRFLSFALVMGAFFLAACGGSGGPSIPSPFAGAWAGNAAITGSGNASGGTLTLIINEPGSTSVTIKGVTNITQTGTWEGSLLIQSGPDAGGSVLFNAARQ